MQKRKNRINRWPTYTLAGVFLVFLICTGFFVYENNQRIATEVMEKNTATLSQVKILDSESENSADWQTIYPKVESMTIGNKEVLASIAKTWPERIQGLSDTPYLPKEVVKLFVFDSEAMHSFWMKDMNYAIDIIWLDKTGKVVYIQEEAAPESYPAAFVSDTLALYVVETVAGFVAENNIKVGDGTILPKI